MQKIMSLCMDCLQMIKDNYNAEVLGEAKERGNCDYCGKKGIYGTVVKILGKAYQSRDSEYAKK